VPNAKASESAIPVSRQPTRAKTSYNSKLSRVTSHDLSLTVRFDTAILSSIIGLLSRPCPRIGLPNWTCGSFPGFAARMERRVFLLRSQFRPCLKLSLRLPPPAVALAISLWAVFLLASPASPRISEWESKLFGSLNRARLLEGLPELRWDAALANTARKHALLMAEQNLLLHQLPSEPDLATRARAAGANFSRVRENIASGPNPGKFHDGWMWSPGHRANILDPQVDSVGIAVVRYEQDEDLFAVEDFAASVKELSIEEQEKQVAELLAARSLRLLDIVDDARRTCALEEGFVGKRRPHYIAHFETFDLSHLPPGVESAIQNHRFGSAAVGACNPLSTSEFKLYRIVVLLF